MKLPLLVGLSIANSISFLATPGSTPGSSTAHPNIICILADDIGYGDVSALNSRAAWITANIDRR
ncbi:MAG: hypothetical protein GY790_00630 [Bacteroidetes bacterium]|nr:hypothetical protein [Bacteroidota bacterium]